jgi:hypothetical protein
MRAVMMLLALFLAAVPGLAGERDGEVEQEKAEVDRSEPDSVIDALYRAVSFELGGQPDWATLKSLFLEGAVLAQPRRGTRQLELLSVDQFIARFEADLKTFEERGTGFSERVAGSQCSTFGRVADCRVVFEARFDPASPDPVGRGVDHIQLVRNGKRWWIAAIATEYERADQPLSQELTALIEPDQAAADPLAGCSKLGFDFAELDERGLVGSGNGKVALDYEFCVPNDPNLVDEVRAIDPSVAIHTGSSGRVGCGPEEVLCIGSTRQKDPLGVLAALCELDFVGRIEHTHWE